MYVHVSHRHVRHINRQNPIPEYSGMGFPYTPLLNSIHVFKFGENKIEGSPGLKIKSQNSCNIIKVGTAKLHACDYIDLSSQAGRPWLSARTQM